MLRHETDRTPDDRRITRRSQEQGREGFARIVREARIRAATGRRPQCDLDCPMCDEKDCPYLG